jgi:hypothetical protein
MDIDPVHSTVARGASVRWKVFEGSTVLLNVDTGDYYTLNGSGTLVWELLERPVTGSDILAALCTGFDVEEPQARQDLAEFLTDLAREGLISIHEGSGGTS